MIDSVERTRLEILKAYHILDSAPEREYDDLTRLAAKICETPIALISLVDHHRQWFKSRLGVASQETPREHSFCAHAMEQEAPLVIEDAMLDERFVENPLVTGEPHIRFYAGVALRAQEGVGLGALCVIDHRPRRLTREQSDLLMALGRQVMRIMELRRVSAELAESLARMRSLEGCLPICSYCSSIRDEEGTWHSLEQYVSSRTDATFTHGLCQSCYDTKRWTH